MYCCYCGQPIPEDANFCPECGKKKQTPIKKTPAQVQTPQDSKTGPIAWERQHPESKRPPIDSPDQEKDPQPESDIEKKLWIAAIGRNAQYYLFPFQHKPPSRQPFNWAAFFFPSIWFSFRRMYWYALLAISLVILSPYLAVVSSGLTEPTTIASLSILFSLAIHYGFGQAANRLLQERLKGIINFALRTFSSQSEAMAYVAKEGGTSWLGVLVFLLGLFILGPFVLILLDSLVGF